MVILDRVISSLAFVAVSFAIFLVCRIFDRRLALGAGLLFAMYLGLDDLATSLPSIWPASRLFEGRWNWSGKVYSILLSILVLLGLGIGMRAGGLTLAQRNVKSSLLAVFILTLLSCSLGFLFLPPIPTRETIAFQALMPGLAEELAYRGIAPVILLGLFHGRAAPDKTPWGVVLVTALAFGVRHGLGYSNASFSFDAISAAFTLIGGIAYGWLRFHSGSLLLPILAHGLGNNAFYLASLRESGRLCFSNKLENARGVRESNRPRPIRTLGWSYGDVCHGPLRLPDVRPLAMPRLVGRLRVDVERELRSSGGAKIAASETF